MRIAVGSNNPVKVKAVEAVTRAFNDEVIGVNVPSGVSEQPRSDKETKQGAINRAEASLKKANAYLGIGLEGGIVDLAEGMFVCNWGALVDTNGQIFISSGACFQLPEEIAIQLRSGRELGPVIDEFAGKKDIRKKDGAIGIFTCGMLTRKEMYEQIVKVLIGQYMYYYGVSGRVEVDT